MGEKTSIKAKVFSIILTLTAMIVFFALGRFEMNKYKDLEKSCTSEVTGTVTSEGSGKLYGLSEEESRYLSSKYWRKISVETDGRFKLKTLYANADVGQKGDEVKIFYDPDEPGKYHIGDGHSYYKSVSIVSYTGSGIMLLLLTLAVIATLKQYKSEKLMEQEQEGEDGSYFNSPYGRFIYDKSDGNGYECEVDWPGNARQENKITAYFESRGQGIMAPGKCFAVLEKILADKKRIDWEIKKLAADHFLFRPETIGGEADESALMEQMMITYISSKRNGDVVYDLDTYAGSFPMILASDIRVTVRAGGSKEIQYTLDGKTALMSCKT